MPRTKLTTPEADTQFRAAVGKTLRKVFKDAPGVEINIGSQFPGDNATAQDALRSLVDRIERLEVEKAEAAEAIKEVYAEARGGGFNVKVLRLVVRRRRRRRQEVQEEDDLVSLYEEQLE